VRERLATWLDATRAEVAPKSAERYAEIVNNYLAPALGNLQLAKLNPVHIQDAYNGWASGGRRDGKVGGLAPRTRRHLHRILSAALARAVENQLIARNPCDVFKKRLPRSSGARWRPLPPSSLRVCSKPCDIRTFTGRC